MSRKQMLVAGSAVTLAVAACAAEPPPRGEIRTAGDALGEAIEADARLHAPEHLTLAQDKLDRASAALDEGEHTAARRLAEQAEVDADRAEAEARSEIAQRNIAEIRASLNALRDALDQSPATSS